MLNLWQTQGHLSLDSGPFTYLRNFIIYNCIVRLQLKTNGGPSYLGQFCCNPAWKHRTGMESLQAWNSKEPPVRTRTKNVPLRGGLLASCSQSSSLHIPGVSKMFSCVSFFLHRIFLFTRFLFHLIKRMHKCEMQNISVAKRAKFG